jgi:hypothetical protein
MLEEQALVDDLLRRPTTCRGQRPSDAPSSSTEQRHERSGRKHGWRIRTFLVDGGAGIFVVWVDRGETDLEKQAVMITMSTGRNYDEVVEEVRRHNLKPVEDA